MKFFYRGLDRKYIEYAQFYLESKEKKYINETKYDGILTGQEINEKQSKLKQIIEISNKSINKVFLSGNDYNTLHELAVTKGGFLSMKFRREIYKKLLYYSSIPSHTASQLKIKISTNQNQNNNQINNSLNKDVTNNNNLSTAILLGPYYLPQLQYFRNCWINKSLSKIYWTNDFLYSYLTKSKISQVIKSDVLRCSINEIFPSETHSDINNFLKKNAEISLNMVTNFNKSELKYYQGYHDIFMQFFYLYLDSPYTYISLFQRFSELYIKENLLSHNDKYGKGFTFPNCIKLCLEIIKKIDIFTYNNLVEFCHSNCSFVIPSIVTLFTHNINNLFLKYRLLDYFLVSHPISVYIMVSLIVIDETAKIKTEFNNQQLKLNAVKFFGENNDQIIEDTLNETAFFVHFQKINFDKIDFEQYIAKTEEILKNFDFEEIINEFTGTKYEFKKYYPLMNKDKYLGNLIKYDFDKNNDNVNSPLANLIFNSKLINYIVNTSQKIYNKITKQITQSKIYNTYVKAFPWFFFGSCIFVVPSTYLFTNKLH